MSTSATCSSSSSRAAATCASTVRTPLYVGDSIPALRMIELFRTSGVHLALVVDEYGDLEGMVTPTDILTGIAGDLPEAGEATSERAFSREDGSWLLDGSLPVDSRRAAARRRGHGLGGLRHPRRPHHRGARPSAGRRANTSPSRAGASRSSISTAAASTRCSPAAPETGAAFFGKSHPQGNAMKITGPQPRDQQRRRDSASSASG